ncbi:MAG: hypothetical protein IJF15_05185 [Oscillospiraceae bacterium]|nr:hypothetical protein [Oscillospiraceae bacterium]
MKKALSIVLVLVMALSLCTVALAGNDELATIGQAAKVEVKARSSAGGDAGTVYSVDVSWGAMQFTYTTGTYSTWDPDIHDYTEVSANNWIAQGNDITVSNHSNAAVKVNIAPDQGATWNPGSDTINVSICSDSGLTNAYQATTLANAETHAPGNPEGADSVTAFVKLAGAYTGSEQYTPIGNIVVSFAAA